MSIDATPRSEPATRIDGADVLRVIHADLFGRQRGKQYPASALDALTEDGLAYSKVSLAEDLMGTPVDTAQFPDLARHPDLHAVIEPTTRRDVPWSPGSSWVLSHLVEHGTASALCARGQLAGAISNLAEKHGLSAVAAGEPEFYLFLTSGDRQPYAVDGVSYTMDRITDPSGAVDRIHRALLAFDIGVTVVNREFSPGQFEINLLHAPAAEAADRAFLLKTAIKELAVIEGLHANFMAKPLSGEEGSSLHMHVSLWEGDRNAFDSGDGQLTPLALAAIAGVQHHARALMSFAAPTVNSYKRLTGEGLSPRTTSWGEDDRFSFLRIPAERGNATRFELRAGDASASPHLLLAGILNAASDGIARGMTPSAEGEALPRDLEESLAALEADTVMRDAFGDEFINVYAALKRAEIAAHRAHVSDWEIGLYARAV